MTCADARERLIDRLLGDLSDEQAERLEAHLAGCRGCRAEADRAVTAWDFLGADPDHHPEPVGRPSLEAVARASLGAPPRRRNVGRVILRCAAAVVGATVVFLGGLAMGSASTPDTTVGDDTYIILVHESEAGFQKIPGDERRAAGRAYVEWERRHRESRELLDAAWLPAEGAVWIDGRDAEVAEREFDPEDRALSYYWLVRAESVERALEIARSCPFLRIGARLELRRATSPAGGAG